MNERPIQHSVQLGCGTLIVIALIVMFFSGGRDTTELRSQLSDLHRKVDRLESKIDALSQRLNPPPEPKSKEVERP
jgi:hypothetical protein